MVVRAKVPGTFYTRPQLAVPITWRTLEPLAYTTADDGTRVPRKPEEGILALKVCDPACGSASFLVAALHYLTDALYNSLVYHHRINEQPKGVVRGLLSHCLWAHHQKHNRKKRPCQYVRAANTLST